MIPFLREGRVVRRKYRRFDVEEGKWTADKGGERIVFNEDCLRDGALRDEPVIITEGELDAIAAIQCGHARTVSVPDGAPPPGERSRDELEGSAKYSWFEGVEPLLRGVKQIVLATDGDANGLALMRDLAKLLGVSRCKFVTYHRARQPELLGRTHLKDLNEELHDYGRRGLVEVIDKAKWIAVDGVYRMSELPPLPPSMIYDIGFEALSEHYKLRLGDFAVWTGIPSHGKTTVVNDLCCRVALNHGLKIGWASFEQTPQRDHKRALRTWFNRVPESRQTEDELRAADEWIERQHVFLAPGDSEDVTLEWMLDKIEVAVLRHGVRVVVIDPWNEMDHDWSRHETEALYTNRAVKALKRCSRALQFHLIVVAHPTKLIKGQDGKYPVPSLYDINGGAVWHNKADLGVVVHRDDEMNTRVKVAKSKHHDVIGRPGAVLMHFCADDRRFVETERLP